MTTTKPRSRRRAALIAAGSLAAVLVLGSGIVIGRMQPVASEGPAPTSAATSTQPAPDIAPTAPTQPRPTGRASAPATPTQSPASTPASIPTDTPVALPPAGRVPAAQTAAEPYNPPPIIYPTTPACPKAGVKVGVTDVQYDRTSGLIDFYRATITVENTTGIPITPRSYAEIAYRYGTEKTDRHGGLITLPEKLPPGRTVFTSKNPDEEISMFNLMDVPVTSLRLKEPVEFGNTDNDYDTTSRYCSWTAKVTEPLVGHWGNATR